MWVVLGSGCKVLVLDTVSYKSKLLVLAFFVSLFRSRTCPDNDYSLQMCVCEIDMLGIFLSKTKRECYRLISNLVIKCG